MVAMVMQVSRLVLGLAGVMTSGCMLVLLADAHAVTAPPPPSLSKKYIPPEQLAAIHQQEVRGGCDPYTFEATNTVVRSQNRYGLFTSSLRFKLIYKGEIVDTSSVGADLDDGVHVITMIPGCNGESVFELMVLFTDQRTEAVSTRSYFFRAGKFVTKSDYTLETIEEVPRVMR